MERYIPPNGVQQILQIHCWAYAHVPLHKAYKRQIQSETLLSIIYMWTKRLKVKRKWGKLHSVEFCTA